MKVTIDQQHRPTLKMVYIKFLQSWKKVLGHLKVTQINQAPVADSFVVQHRVIHHSKERFSNIQLSYYSHAKVAIAGCQYAGMP